MEINQIGILGAGTMGRGIAHSVAKAGFEVFLLDLSEQLVKDAVRKIEKNLVKNVEKEKLTLHKMEQILKKIHPITDMAILSDSNLIIEAIFEDLQLKTDLLRKASDICLNKTIFASNTSTIPVTRMANAVSKPERFLGLHFFNPAPIMKLVEVIPGLRTSGDTLGKASDFVKKIKKVPIVVKECPGFLVSRIFMAYAGEAMLAAQEGAASPQEIDESVKKIGFPMGPLTLNDMVGMDVGVHTFPIMHEAYGERFPVPLLFERLVKSHRLGVKSGKGIYVNGNVDDEFREIVRQIQNETGIRNTQFSADRLILRQVNEAIFCLQEQIAAAEDIDRAMVLGTGFPSDGKGIGGPLHWADEIGLDRVLEQLERYKSSLGARFWPHHLLKKYVYAGYLGKKAKRGFFTY